MRKFKIVLAVLCLISIAVAPTKLLAIVIQASANVPVEIPLQAQRPHADPFNDLTVDVLFADPAGQQFKVPAFWDGGSLWMVRYASPLTGTHTFQSMSSDTADSGLHGIKGRVEISPYSGTNALFLHGPIRVADDKRHFSYADGKPFFWLGDTWWMGLCNRLHWPDEFKQLADDRRAKGFTVVQIVAGLYPDMPAFDPRGANEAGFPWETNYARIRPEYFDKADQRINALVESGFTPCIVGAWGYFLPWMGVEKAKQHWRYLIARYGAMPVVWCAAGEANLPYYLAPGFPYHDAAQVKGWTEVMRYIREIDPYHRPLTIHPTGIGRLSARNATEDWSLLDFDMLQTPHGEADAIEPTIRTVRESYADRPTMPVIDGEASYEMLNGKIAAQWPRAMFWICMLNGAAGHTYGANGIWQCNRRDQPHGNSPHGGNYGTIPWDDAMKLPGSGQIGLAKNLFEQYRWQQFKPHPEWAAFVNEASQSLAGSHWIWFVEGNPAKNAPTAKRFFRKTVVLPEGKAISKARLAISADDKSSARLNGQAVGEGAGWQNPNMFDDLAGKLKPGTNVLAVIAENQPANVPENPAGLIACLEIQLADTEPIRIATDASWQSATNEVTGWDAATFDASAWPKCAEIASCGDPPWNNFQGQNKLDQPQAAGIPGVVRIVWVPRAGPIEVRNLGSGITWNGTFFNPVSGERSTTVIVRADDSGKATVSVPGFNTGALTPDQDWALILEPKKLDATKQSRSHLTLSSKEVAWQLDWNDGTLRTTSLENKLSGRTFSVSAAKELQLVFSAAPDRIAEPLKTIIDFDVRHARANDNEAVFDLGTGSMPIDVTAHYELDGPTRRKWVEVKNRGTNDVLLLDVVLDNFVTEGASSGGGQGQPVFVEDEIFAAIEHPSGDNVAAEGVIHLTHHPGRRIAPGAVFRSQAALVSISESGAALDHFLDYVQEHSIRKKKVFSVYTPFGINNQWGGCPALNDEQTLDVLNLLGAMQRQGARFDYFTLDTGWVDPTDLKRFRPGCFPEGPGKIVEQVNSLGMNFGLWFATSWGAESCWNDAAALAGQPPTAMTYRLGYPDKYNYRGTFCFGSPTYFNTLSNAVIHHIRENKARFIKFDGGNYYCDNPAHGHLPGKYSTEQMHDELIALADAARTEAPDTFVMWYWGLRSPFWALHGDTIFESGLQMEGSGTSISPALYYRDSVTLAQDQNAQFARTIPPLVKDSLGVWLADTRWGNFMGKERWREALVMDLGRGNLLFPNLWGNLYNLTEDDVAFLGKMSKVARQNERLFLHRRNILGDPMRNELYGYAYCADKRGFIFINNMHFAARRTELRLDSSVGLDGSTGTSLEIISQFPESNRLVRPDGKPWRIGDTAEVWLRPFEVLMLEIEPRANRSVAAPVRAVTADAAKSYSTSLPLQKITADPKLEVQFTDAARFEQQKFKKKTLAFETTLSALEGDQPILAIAIKLRAGAADWRHAPVVAEIVQARAQIGGQEVGFIPVPDGRQFGNTQSTGCSWVVYKTRLGRQFSGQKAWLIISSYLPDGVDAQVEAWVVKRWWQENTQPSADGYYNDAPS